MAVKHKAQRAAAGAVLDQLLKYVDKDPQANLLKLMDKVQGIVGNLFPAKSLEGIRKGAEDPENVWNQFAMSILRDIDRDVIKKMFLALGLHAAYHGTKTVRENREKYQCNIPNQCLQPQMQGLLGGGIRPSPELELRRAQRDCPPGQGNGHPFLYVHGRGAARAQG